MSIGFNISMIAGRSALQTATQEMAVIANNLANVNVEGYHKQTVSQGNNTPVLSSEAYYGSGVHIESIVREYDVALENSLNMATNQYGYYSAYYKQLSQIEDLVLPEGENFLDESIQNFANAIQDVATTPESITARNSLIGTAEILADRFNQEYASLEEIRTYLAEDTSTGAGAISEYIGELNSMAEELATLNDDIMLLEQSAFNGQQANDYRDRRDELIRKMSELADISVTETEDYRYTVTLNGEELVSNPKAGNSTANTISFSMIASAGTATSGSATTLVDSSNPWTGMDLTGKIVKITSSTGETQEIAITSNTANTLNFDNIDLNFTPDSSTTYEIYDPTLTWETTGKTADVGNGYIKGLIDGREYVVNKMTELDYFARDFADIVNSAMKTGSYPAGSDGAYDLDGNLVTDDFFDASTPGQMSVLITDGRKIGASTNASETGNGDNMVNLWDAMDTAQSSPPTRTLNSDSILNYTDRYNRTIAVDVSTASDQFDAAEASKTMFQNSVSNRSGVNSDEEMTNMLEVQRAYQAAAKFINVIDGMLGTLIEMV